MTERVFIVDYDPRWPALFKEEKACILTFIGEYIEDIQHVGSTSVPGLGAKPIIDIMIAMHDLTLVEKCLLPLQSLDYEYRGLFGIPGRHFLHKPSGPAGRRTHHIHIVQTDYPQWRKLILFRDYLRAHPEDAQLYDELKRKLAGKYGDDREGYTNAKADFVEDILARAAIVN